MWFFKKKVSDKHVHCWSNWQPYAESLNNIVDGSGKAIKQYRVIEQRRKCGLCGFIEIDAVKLVIGSINLEDIGKREK